MNEIFILKRKDKTRIINIRLKRKYNGKKKNILDEKYIFAGCHGIYRIIVQIMEVCFVSFTISYSKCHWQQKGFQAIRLGSNQVYDTKYFNVNIQFLYSVTSKT